MDMMNSDQGMQDQSVTQGTLEERGLQLFKKHGYDTTDPRVKAAVVTISTKLRQDNPGMTDDDIARTQGPRIAAAIQEGAPSYQAQMQEIQKKYSPEEEAKVRQEAADRQSLLQIGRNLGSSARIAAGPEANKILDQEYAESSKNAQRPYTDWQAKKQAEISQLEEQIKMGDADANAMRARLTRIGLEQALEERANARVVAQAEADPNSITSESYRQLARQYAPDLVAKLGNKFMMVTAGQLKGMMPSLEKAYLKKIEVEQKKAELEDKAKDRASREKVASTTAGATVQAARIRANATRDAAAARAGAGAGTGGLKPGERLAIEKEEGKVNEALAGAQEAVDNYNRLEELINKGLSTGPIVGSDVVGGALKLVSKDRQAADSIVKNIVQASSKAFGGNPTEGERRYIEEANSVMKLDDPLPRLRELRSKFETLVQQREDRLNNLRGMRGEAPVAPVAPKPPKVPKTNAKGWKLMTDKDGNMAYVSPDGKSFEEI